MDNILEPRPAKISKENLHVASAKARADSWGEEYVPSRDEETWHQTLRSLEGTERESLKVAHPLGKQHFLPGILTQVLEIWNKKDNSGSLNINEAFLKL